MGVSGAIGTAPVKCQIVMLNPESIGREPVHGPWAGMDPEHTVAGVAMEVVMVVLGVTVGSLAQDLIPSRLTRQIDPRDLAGFQQIL